MGIEASDLKHLSSLLDAALDLAPEAREAWLDTLPADAQALAPVLRNLLARHASGETLDFIDRPPAFDPPRDDASADRALAAGAMVGPYRLLRELGAGGMGEVWLAERADGTLKRQVALKLPTLGVRRAILVQRFERERDILAGLEHPKIARLYDAGFAADGQPYLALEFVEGRPIDAWCREQALPIAERVKLLLQVAEAVAYAHSRLVLHRDLKPGNILVTAEGQVRLLDFGIAKLIEGESAAETQLTRLAGRALTLDYASPEQIRGEPIGTASDVYSLGVVAFELLAGVRPYKLKRGSVAELEETIAGTDAPLASSLAGDPLARKQLRGDLDAILNKALKRNAPERYTTVDALAQDVERYLAGQRIVARPDSLAYRLTRIARRYRTPLLAATITAVAFGLAIGVGATALVILALLLGLGAALWQERKARALAEVAREQTRIAQTETRTTAAVRQFLLDLVGSTDPDSGRGRDTTTVEMLLGARERIEGRFGAQPAIQVSLLREVGYALLGLDEADRSMELFEAAIELGERHLPTDHVDVLNARLNLGEALLHAGRERDARVPLARALDGMRRIDDASGLVAALRWTSRRHSSLREPDLAIAAAEEAVAIGRRRLGPQDLQTMLNAEHELLEAQRFAGRGNLLDQARRVLELTEALYPNRVVRPKLAAREAYGSALAEEGDAVEGVKLLQSVLADATTLFGPHDRMVGWFAGRLMSGQLALGDAEGALASAQLARRNWDEVHGERMHSDLAFGRLYEGHALLALQRLPEAESLLIESAALFERSQGPGSPVTPLARSGAALARARAGDLAGAQTLLDVAPATIVNSEGAAVSARLGMLRQMQGRPGEAEPLLRAALDYAQQRGAPPLRVATLRTWLAATLVDVGRNDEAKALLEAALAVFVPKQPASSPTQAEAWEALARAELAVGRPVAAGEAASKAAAYWQRVNAQCAPAARAELLVAQAHLREGDTAGAANAYRRALAGAGALRLPSDRLLLAQTAGSLGLDAPRLP